MSVLDWISASSIHEWSSSRGVVGNRLAIAWKEKFANGKLTSLEAFAAYGADGAAYWIKPENIGAFLAAHAESTWVLGQSLEGLCWLEKFTATSFENRIQKRTIISLKTIYPLICLCEFQEAAESTELNYLTRIYLQTTLTSDGGDFSPALMNLPELPSTAKQQSIYTAIELAIASWEIFTAMWKEALGYSDERTLLGYDRYALAEYYLQRPGTK